MKSIRNQCLANNIRFYQLPTYPKGFLTYYLDCELLQKAIK